MEVPGQIASTCSKKDQKRKPKQAKAGFDHPVRGPYRPLEGVEPLAELLMECWDGGPLNIRLSNIIRSDQIRSRAGPH